MNKQQNQTLENIQRHKKMKNSENIKIFEQHEKLGKT